MTLLYIILATLFVSLLSLVGGLVLVLQKRVLNKITKSLVAFSAGSLLGGAFLHLIPEALEEIEQVDLVMLWVLLGFGVFFVLEQFISWHHCHRMPGEHKHPVTYLILVSDSIHNFLDGLTVGAAFLASPSLGVATTLAIVAHEIPQELGDLGILLHGGWKKSKALWFNFLTGLTMILGGLLAWFLGRELSVIYLLPFAAGNFIYISAGDLVPEIKGCDRFRQNIAHFLMFLLGIGLMFGLKGLD